MKVTPGTLEPQPVMPSFPVMAAVYEKLRRSKLLAMTQAYFAGIGLVFLLAATVFSALREPAWSAVFAVGGAVSVALAVGVAMRR